MENVAQENEKAIPGAIKIDEKEIRTHLDGLVRQSVEDTLNALLNAEADAICQASRYQRSPDRQDTRAESYKRKLLTKAGEVELHVPRLRALPFETQIIERYKTKQSRVEEALIEMYLAGVSVRRVEDITEALWGAKVSSSTVSELNQKIYGKIEEWRKQPITGEHPFVSDKCLGLYEIIGDFFPEAKWQRCIVHWYRNAFTMCPWKHLREVVAMLKAIHAQEDKAAARQKAALVAEKLRAMKLERIAGFVETSVEETLSYMDFPYEHWSRLRTNISTTKWGTRQYMNICKLYEGGIR